MSSLALKRVLVKASPGFDNSTVKTMDTASQSQVVQTRRPPTSHNDYITNSASFAIFDNFAQW